MKFDISEQEAKSAKIPHELFLVNLIGNHILWFVAALGIVKSLWQPLALVPIVSFSLLTYILWGSRRARKNASWFVMCHWQLAAGRSRFFIYLLAAALTVSLLGWLGHIYLGMRDVEVYALIGGVGLLPIMVTVLVLIILESDALHLAVNKKLPKSILERFPNPGVAVLEDDAIADVASQGSDK